MSILNVHVTLKLVGILLGLTSNLHVKYIYNKLSLSLPVLIFTVSTGNCIPIIPLMSLRNIVIIKISTRFPMNGEPERNSIY